MISKTLVKAGRRRAGPITGSHVAIADTTSQIVPAVARSNPQSTIKLRRRFGHSTYVVIGQSDRRHGL